MVPEELRAAVEAAIRDKSGVPFRIVSAARTSGGCIHDSYRIDDGHRSYFLKCNRESLAEIFASEMDGLRALSEAGMRVPLPVCRGSAAGRAFLVMEHLDFGGHGDWALMGRALAAMHRTAGRQFGWRRDNFIGSTPQRNREHDKWVEFWRDERLLPQLALAKRNGLESRVIELGERLGDALPELLGGHKPQPSLLHGDLWRGNADFLADGAPALFDPAVYYGDREADLAMTELFGGFPRQFYAAYQTMWPLPAGYETRRDLYNLYHVLNHANLFGGGYSAQAGSIIERLLSER